jgi:hypothetical protein
MRRLTNYAVLTGLLLGNLACWLLAVWGARELLS